MGIGRPRGFKVDEALDQAQTVFCRLGYDAASLSELTKAMGINSPSLYAAFGSKEGLFRAVMDRYALQRVQYLEAALEAPTARETVQSILAVAARLYSEDKDQASWLVMRGGAACGCPTIADDLSSRRERIVPWLALLVPPLAWMAFEYGLGSSLRVSCGAVGAWLGPLWGGGSLLACAAAAAAAWRMGRGTDADPPVRPWLARVATVVAGIFAVAIALQTLATLIVPSCAR